MLRHSFLTKPRKFKNPHGTILVKLKEPIERTARKEKATVYWGGGRRWFSLKQAAKAEARWLLKQKCDCYSDWGSYYSDPSNERVERCRYHKMEQHEWKKLRDRIARRIIFYWRKRHGGEKEADAKTERDLVAQTPSQSIIEPGSSIGGGSSDAGIWSGG